MQLLSQCDYNEIEENNFFGIKGLDEVTVEFGVLYTAVGRKNIASFVGIDIVEDNPIECITKSIISVNILP